MKICTKCRVPKPATTEFFYRSRHRLESRCKQCRYAVNRAHLRTNRHKPVVLSPTLLDRFWSSVQKTERCWLWIRTKNSDGYGQFWNGRHLVAAHRFAWEILRGPIPEGMNVLHKCDTPPCVNAFECLFLGTQKDNAYDMIQKGRANRNPPSGDNHPWRKNPELVRRGEFHPMARLKACDIHLIRAAYKRKHGVTKEIARQFGVNPKTIQAIVARRSWKHI